jgi:hypothetical protein
LSENLPYLLIGRGKAIRGHRLEHPPPKDWFDKVVDHYVLQHLIEVTIRKLTSPDARVGDRSQVIC